MDCFASAGQSGNGEVAGLSDAVCEHDPPPARRDFGGGVNARYPGFLVSWCMGESALPASGQTLPASIRPSPRPDRHQPRPPEAGHPFSGPHPLNKTGLEDASHTHGLSAAHLLSRRVPPYPERNSGVRSPARKATRAGHKNHLQSCRETAPCRQPRRRPVPVWKCASRWMS